MSRFYIITALLGYDVIDMLSFQPESEIAIVIYDLGQIFN